MKMGKSYKNAFKEEKRIKSARKSAKNYGRNVERYDEKHKKFFNDRNEEYDYKRQEWDDFNETYEVPFDNEIE